MLEWRDVTVDHDGRALVAGATLAVAAGELVVVAGPNGAGKSTLVRAMTGEWTPARGSVRLFGREREDWDRRELAKRFAALPQKSSLAFDFLVGEVVALGRLPHRESGSEATLIDRALAQVGLDGFGRRNYLELSAGEQQRVHVARVLAQVWESDRGALLLDEPTSALDLGQQQRLLDLLWRWSRRGFAVCIVLHDLNLAARYADRLVMVADGRVEAAGSPTEVLQANRLERIYRCELSVDAHPVDGRPLVALTGPARLERP